MPDKKRAVSEYPFNCAEPEFPFAVNRIGAPAASYAYSYHSHPEVIELQYIHRGTGWYFIKNRRYPLRDRSLLIIHRHELHSYIPAEKTERLDKVHVIFSYPFFRDCLPHFRRLLNRVLLCRRNFSHQLQLTAEEAARMEMLILSLDTEYVRKGPLYREAISGLLLQLLVLIERCGSPMSRVQKPGAKSPLIDRVLAYADEHLKEQLALTDVAKQVQRSPFHLSRLFRQETGLTLREYINRRRVAEAKSLLENRKKSIIDTAYEAGFSSLRSFNRAFKRYTGTTPAAYRKLWLKHSN